MTLSRLISADATSIVNSMARAQRRLTPLLFLSLATTAASAAGPPAQASAIFDSYTREVEAGLSSKQPFVPATRLRRGDILIQSIPPPSTLHIEGAMLSHWRATTFIPNGTVSQMQTLLQDIPAYPRYFAPQVLRANILTQHNSQMQMSMRVRQHHVITVVLDSAYNVSFGPVDAQHGYSFSRSTRIQEIESPGTSTEHALSPSEDHGFLWRQNTYWTYEQRDGGLYVQVESVSLSRSIPTGLGWAVGPYVQSIPRDSLEFTLQAVSRALETSSPQPAANLSSLERKSR